MDHDSCIEGLFTSMHNSRSGLIDRAERLAEITIASVCTADEYDTAQDSLTNGFSSLGAQCVTNLVNKLMLAMFSASRPFFRLAIEEREANALIGKLNISMDQLTDVLSLGERDALLKLEMLGCRDALYEGITHLVVVGNVLMDLRDKEAIVFHPIKDYVCKRDARGRPVRTILRECMAFSDLSRQAREYLTRTCPGMFREHEDVVLYTEAKLVSSTIVRYRLQVNKVPLPDSAFGSRTNVKDARLIPLAWRLPLKQSYGVGRVEDYYNDLASHETISESLNDGAVLSSQFRWLQNPGGVTNAADLQNTENGAVIPGTRSDLELIFANIGNQLQNVSAIGNVYSGRVGQGFLLNSAVTRQAERVTAEEIRLQAQELEGSLGGNYSRLAKEVQGPIARWLLKQANVEVSGTKIEPVVITGIDALSRNADLEKLVQFMVQVDSLSQIQPQTRMLLQESNIIADIAAGLGVPKTRYVASNEEVQQRMAAMQQAQPQTGEVPQ